MFNIDGCVTELGLGNGAPGMGSGSGSLYLGSLQNLSRGRTGAGDRGIPGQGRITPTQFGSRGMGGLGQGINLLQSSSSNSRNPLFNRKMGYVIL